MSGKKQEGLHNPEVEEYEKYEDEMLLKMITIMQNRRLRTLQTMDEENNKKWGIISMFLLIISYWLIRHYFFALHGMKQCPNILALISIPTILISNIRGNRIIPVASIVGFVGGFILTMVFRAGGPDPGGSATNNGWIIWAAFFSLSIIVGIISGFISKNKFKNAGDS